MSDPEKDPDGALAPAPAHGEEPPAPAWFRSVVWSSLTVGLTRLMPIPFLDDLVAIRLRRSMVRRLAGERAVGLGPHDVRALAGGGRGFSCLGLLGKAVIYPLRKILRKILYFLSIKDAVDTFSRVFHQGYLLHSALAAGALGSGDPPSAEAVERVRSAVFGTLDEVDTSPLENTVRGVFRHSRDLVRGMVRWARRRLPTRAGIQSVDAAGQDAASLEAASPEAEALLDRLLVVMWAKRDYRRDLEDRLARRLHHPTSPSTG